MNSRPQLLPFILPPSLVRFSLPKTSPIPILSHRNPGKMEKRDKTPQCCFNPQNPGNPDNSNSLEVFHIPGGGNSLVQFPSPGPGVSRMDSFPRIPQAGISKSSLRIPGNSLCSGKRGRGAGLGLAPAGSGLGFPSLEPNPGFPGAWKGEGFSRGLLRSWERFFLGHSQPFPAIPSTGLPRLNILVTLPGIKMNIQGEHECPKINVPGAGDGNFLLAALPCLVFQQFSFGFPTLFPVFRMGLTRGLAQNQFGAGPVRGSGMPSARNQLLPQEAECPWGSRRSHVDPRDPGTKFPSLLRCRGPRGTKNLISENLWTARSQLSALPIPVAWSKLSSNSGKIPGSLGTREGKQKTQLFSSNPIFGIEMKPPLGGKTKI